MWAKLMRRMVMYIRKNGQRLVITKPYYAMMMMVMMIQGGDG